MQFINNKRQLVQNNKRQIEQNNTSSSSRNYTNAFWSVVNNTTDETNRIDNITGGDETLNNLAYLINSNEVYSKKNYYLDRVLADYEIKQTLIDNFTTNTKDLKYEFDYYDKNTLQYNLIDINDLNNYFMFNNYYSFYNNTADAGPNINLKFSIEKDSNFEYDYAFFNIEADKKYQLIQRNVLHNLKLVLEDSSSKLLLNLQPFYKLVLIISEKNSEIDPISTLHKVTYYSDYDNKKYTLNFLPKNTKDYIINFDTSKSSAIFALENKDFDNSNLYIQNEFTFNRNNVIGNAETQPSINLLTNEEKLLYDKSSEGTYFPINVPIYPIKRSLLVYDSYINTDNHLTMPINYWKNNNFIRIYNNEKIYTEFNDYLSSYPSILKNPDTTNFANGKYLEDKIVSSWSNQLIGDDKNNTLYFNRNYHIKYDELWSHNTNSENKINDDNDSFPLNTPGSTYYLFNTKKMSSTNGDKLYSVKRNKNNREPIVLTFNNINKKKYSYKFFHINYELTSSEILEKILNGDSFDFNEYTNNKYNMTSLTGIKVINNMIDVGDTIKITMNPNESLFFSVYENIESRVINDNLIKLKNNIIDNRYNTEFTNNMNNEFLKKINILLTKEMQHPKINLDDIFGKNNNYYLGLYRYVSVTEFVDFNKILLNGKDELTIKNRENALKIAQAYLPYVNYFKQFWKNDKNIDNQYNTFNSHKFLYYYEQDVKMSWFEYRPTDSTLENFEIVDKTFFHDINQYDSFIPASNKVNNPNNDIVLLKKGLPNNNDNFHNNKINFYRHVFNFVYFHVYTNELNSDTLNITLEEQNDTSVSSNLIMKSLYLHRNELLAKNNIKIGKIRLQTNSNIKLLNNTFSSWALKRIRLFTDEYNDAEIDYLSHAKEDPYDKTVKFNNTYASGLKDIYYNKDDGMNIYNNKYSTDHPISSNGVISKYNINNDPDEYSTSIYKSGINEDFIGNDDKQFWEVTLVQPILYNKIQNITVTSSIYDSVSEDAMRELTNYKTNKYDNIYNTSLIFYDIYGNEISEYTIDFNDICSKEKEKNYTTFILNGPNTKQDEDDIEYALRIGENKKTYSYATNRITNIENAHYIDMKIN